MDLVPEGSLPDNGPDNNRRLIVFCQSLWFNTKHFDLPLCRFEDYLVLRGWDQDRLLRGDWRGAHAANLNREDDECAFEALAVIQAWMTFGFLEDLYQERTWLEPYLQPLNEHHAETMRQMFPALMPLDRIARDRDGRLLVFHTKHLASNLVALDMSLRIIQQPTVARANGLKNTITAYVRAFHLLNGLNVYEAEKDQTRNPSHPTSTSWHTGCSCSPHLNFSSKRKSRCIASVVESAEAYPKTHAVGCDGLCERYIPPLDQIIEALASGGVPLIKADMVSDQPRKYTFSVSSFKPSENADVVLYNAFSHVWSHGLGSTSEIGIPSCQVNFLAHTSSTLSDGPRGSTMFWIDSLCIPAHRLQRKRAIERMAATYGGAEVVLVLDQTLRTVQLYREAGDQCRPEYLPLRILTSPWYFRVWTYQEGVLAHKLKFLLADGHSATLDFPLSIDAGLTASALSIGMGRDNLHNIYSYLRAEVQAPNGQIKPINIGHVALELRWRETLYRNAHGRNDEILAAGSVLGINMGRLLQQPQGELRMAMFYKLVGHLYRNIVFAAVPRLQLPGFRWAPSTFLTSDERRPATNLDQDGVDCTAAGLRGQYVTFATDCGIAVHYDDQTAITIEDRDRWFDLAVPAIVDFWFTHIAIYPVEAPQSIRGEIFVAVALIEETQYARPGGVDLVATFQTVVHLSCLRERHGPIRSDRWPLGTRTVRGRMRKTQILFR
ncbi:hypothetical protein LTR97_007273 [Elasticomyces elasticus]|uniref:Heterokaryon incompatibility domain-containing protein n=1 Tax=Elasticomyces elasticus TaxID=574655 RepID=A0AAN7ZN49_9PEZI|nr:hypothetical protein LTR97_007273 [Elasticomyces elasticus]